MPSSKPRKGCCHGARRRYRKITNNDSDDRLRSEHTTTTTRRESTEPTADRPIGRREARSHAKQQQPNQPSLALPHTTFPPRTVAHLKRLDNCTAVHSRYSSAAGWPRWRAGNLASHHRARTPISPSLASPHPNTTSNNSHRTTFRAQHRRPAPDPACAGAAASARLHRCGGRRHQPAP